MNAADTSAKDFNRNPELIDCHIDRVERAHAAADKYFSGSTPLRRQGVVMYTGLLEPEERAILAAEIRNTGPGDAKRPDSLAANAGGVTKKVLPEIMSLVSMQYRTRIGEVIAAMRKTTYRQHLYIAPGDGDVQKVLHRDTFFPALKYWYFPEDVAEGAFTYAHYSAELTENRLAWERRMVQLVKSRTVEPWREPGHSEGSFRVAECELAAMGLQASPVSVPADTFVIANVFGFHCRGDVGRPVSRLSLSGSIRFKNPFDG